MKTIFYNAGVLSITFNDGTKITLHDIEEGLYNNIVDLYKKKSTKDQVLEFLYPDNAMIDHFVKLIDDSNILKRDGEHVYMPSVSKLTLPENFIKKILEAEEFNDNDKLTSYKNFWTLLSLNPNSAVRDNLMWFLNKWGMSITKSGLIVAYRNVDVKQEGLKFDAKLTDFISRNYYGHKHNNVKPSTVDVVLNDNKYAIVPTGCKNDKYIIIGRLDILFEDLVLTHGEAGTVYTDVFTHSMEIRLGHVVSMPRNKCDETQVSCSAGLHAGAKDWLKRNYFGTVGLKVLVNPADVVSCPREDYYGKLRTCAYYPVQVIKFDDCGNVVDDVVPINFEADFMEKIAYIGKINEVDNDNYVISLPIQLNNCEEVYKNLKNIAKNIQRLQ